MYYFSFSAVGLGVLKHKTKNETIVLLFFIYFFKKKACLWKHVFYSL